ncbi:MAG TPA: nucleotide exchange factor GrpE [Dehalococcoidia bacterium]|nr:nucleotide exchange factor GrpE [Dehalococcoidia bacterium]
MSERQEDEARIVDRRASTLPDRSQEQNDPSGQGSSAEALARQLAEETEKAQAYLANWQRAAADYQNYKRRVEQEREEMGRLATAALIINILPILDDLERALQSIDSHLAGLTWVDGIRLIYRKFQAVLEMNGVREIQAEGADFDPNYHEAVAFAEGEDGKVLSVVQKGYTLNNRVLRPAMVVVGKPKDAAG